MAPPLSILRRSSSQTMSISFRSLLNNMGLQDVFWVAGRSPELPPSNQGSPYLSRRLRIRLHVSLLKTIRMSVLQEVLELIPEASGSARQTELSSRVQTRSHLCS